MIDLLKRFFGNTASDNQNADKPADHDIKVATCALLVEIAPKTILRMNT